MQYALLIYGARDAAQPAHAPDAAIAAVLARPQVTGWTRLHADETATTLRHGERGTLLTDGPFVESKEYLVGLIIVEADDLDGALAVAQELQDTRSRGAIEVRPVLDGQYGAA